MNHNSILTETEFGTYYTGPIEPAIQAMRAEYGDSLTVTHQVDAETGTPYVTICEHRGSTPESPNQWGSGSSDEEAWRYLIGADFGPLDQTYENEGYEATQRKMLGLT